MISYRRINFTITRCFTDQVPKPDFCNTVCLVICTAANFRDSVKAVLWLRVQMTVIHRVSGIITVFEAYRKHAEERTFKSSNVSSE